jgi:hypothetical protein
MSVTRKWSLLAAVLVLAIVAEGWFLLIAPKRGEAAALRADTVTQEEANERLLQQLEVLKAQQADLPRQRARLAVLGTQIPDNPALPTLIRDLTKAGRKVGVSIDTMAPAVPVAVVAAQPLAPVATTTESTGTTGTTGSTDSTAAGGATTTDGTTAADGATWSGFTSREFFCPMSAVTTPRCSPVRSWTKLITAWAPGPPTSMPGCSCRLVT